MGPNAPFDGALRRLSLNLVDSHVIHLGFSGVRMNSKLVSCADQIAKCATVEGISLGGSNSSKGSAYYLVAFLGRFTELKRVCMSNLRVPSVQINSYLVMLLLSRGVEELNLPSQTSDHGNYSAPLESLLQFLTNSSRGPSARITLNAPGVFLPGHYAYTISKVRRLFTYMECHIIAYHKCTNLCHLYSQFCIFWGRKLVACD
jgi:hypothetical protein